MGVNKEKKRWGLLVFCLVFSIAFVGTVLSYKFGTKGVVVTAFVNVNSPEPVLTSLVSIMNQVASRDHLLAEAGVSNDVRFFLAEGDARTDLMKLSLKLDGRFLKGRHDKEAQAILEKVLSQFNGFGPLVKMYNDGLNRAKDALTIAQEGKNTDKKVFIYSGGEPVPMYSPTVAAQRLESIQSSKQLLSLVDTVISEGGASLKLYLLILLVFAFAGAAAFTVFFRTET